MYKGYPQQVLYEATKHVNRLLNRYRIRNKQAEQKLREWYYGPGATDGKLNILYSEQVDNNAITCVVLSSGRLDFVRLFTFGNDAWELSMDEHISLHDHVMPFVWREDNDIKRKLYSVEPYKAI